MSLPPAGVHPLGFWEEANTDPFEGVPVILARKRDPDTGEITNLLESDTPADGMIIEGFRVERASGPAVMNIGHTMRQVKHTDEGSIKELEARGREPIDELDELGVVRLNSVKATLDVNDESAVSFDLGYIDLTMPTRDVKTEVFAVPRNRR
jgi:hypothetical protein